MKGREAEAIRLFPWLLQISGVMIFAVHGSSLLQVERNECGKGDPGNRTDHASGEAGLFSPNSANEKGHVKKPFTLLNMH